MRKFDLSGKGSIVSIVGRVEEVSIVCNALRNRNISNDEASNPSNGEAIKQLNLRIELNNKYNLICHPLI